MRKKILSFAGVFVLVMLTIGVCESLSLGVESLATLIVSLILFFGLPLIFIFIQAIVRKIKKKKTYFGRSYIVGVLLIVLWCWLYQVLENYMETVPNNPALVLIAVFLLITAVHAAIPVHFENLFRLIIGKTYSAESTVEKSSEEIESKPIKPEGKLSLFLSKTFSNISNFIKKRKFVMLVSLISLVLITIGVVTSVLVYKAVLNSQYARIVEITPDGLAPQQSAIRVLYSTDIALKNPDDTTGVITIQPAIAGITKVEGRSLIFIPDSPLRIATEYKVSVNGGKLVSTEKKFVESRNFRFNTALLTVESYDYFTEINEVDYSINSVTAEITFNIPFDPAAIRDKIEVKYRNRNIPFEIELSGQSNIVYVRVKGLTQSDRDEEIKFRVLKGLPALGGTIPFASDSEGKTILREKARQTVESIESHPIEGTTLIKVAFGIPVDQSNIKDYIKITPDIPFQVESEYRYAILNANFAVNVEYEIKVIKGARGRYGDPLRDDVVQKIKIEDRASYVAFTAQGRILPMTDNLNIEFESVNLDRAVLTVEKIYKNNLVSFVNGDSYGARKYLHERNLNLLESIGTQTDPAQYLNQEVKHLINLKELFDSDYQGLYQLTLRDPANYYNYSTMLINITDMGIIVKNNGTDINAYIVDVNSLQSASGVKVTLLSRENQTLQWGVTDQNGAIVFNNYSRTRENLIPGIILAEWGDNFTYLQLSDNILDFSSFHINGVPHRNGVNQGYFTTERGVYRPGDIVNSTIIVRSADLRIADNLPVIVKVFDPVGNVFLTETIRLGNQGISRLNIPVEMNTRTGEYTVRLYNGVVEIGEGTFKVEEFIPHTINVKATLVDINGNKVRFKVNANQLHGSPASGNMVSAEYVLYSKLFAPEGFDGYSFYNDDKSSFYQTPPLTIGDRETLDQSGEKIFEFDIPDSYSPPSAYMVRVIAEVYDEAGRTVSDIIEFDFNPYQSYYGMLIDSAPPYEVNKKISIKTAVLDREYNPIKKERVYLRVERTVWYSIFNKYSFGGSFESEQYNEVVMSSYIDIDRTGVFDFTPDRGGLYKVTLGDKDGMMTTKTFFVGEDGFVQSLDLDNPAELKMTLDKEGYVTGETAYLTIVSPINGRVLLTLEKEKVYSSWFINITNGRAVVPISVTADFIPNMFVTAMVFRKPTYEALSLPPVCYGTISINQDKARLSPRVTINANSTVRAADGLPVSVNVRNGAGAAVVIMAVDEGILRLTNFQRPEPYDFFYTKRALGVTTSTSIIELLPDIAPYKRAFGGGGGDEDSETMLREEAAAMQARHLNPFNARRVRSVALVSDVLYCDSSGNASHRFNIPEFNGQLRVMVFTVKDNTFGSAEKSVTVSDPIVLSPGIPRVITVGDEVDLPVTIFNKTGRDGSFTVELITSSNIGVVGNSRLLVDVKNNQQSRVNFKVKPGSIPGIGRIELRARGNGESTVNNTEISVRTPSQRSSVVQSGAIQQGETVTISIDRGFIPVNIYNRLSVSSNRMVLAAGALDYLISYPYGCTEQITARALPLLFMKDFAGFSGVFGQREAMVDEIVISTLDEIEKRITDDGEIGMWPESSHGYPYINNFVYLFIVEAKIKGYSVSDRLYNIVSNKLGIRAAQQGTLDRRNNNAASYNNNPFALYIKARAGVPDFDGMKLFFDQAQDRNRGLDETNKLFLAMAYSVSGENDKARLLLPDNFLIKTAIRMTFGDFSSFVRNTSLYLYALSMINPSSQAVSLLENELFRRMANDGSFGNTQETAWALMALNSVYAARSVEGQAVINIDGRKVADGNNIALGTDRLTGRSITVTNTGTTPVYYNFIASGYPVDPVSAVAENGLKIKREYRDLNGRLVDPSSVKKGDQIIVTLEVVNKNTQTYENLVIADMIPAGLEIENWRLDSGSANYNYPPNSIDIVNSDIRDDRVILFVKSLDRSVRFSYLLKSVSTGRFVIPAAIVEVMYDPVINGSTGGGAVMVISDN